MTRPHSWIGAAEAAALLQVSRPTLYAYVSRGLIRPQDTPGPSRARRYARDDVERLRRRAEERRHPDKIDGKRRKRIARGSGTDASQVNQLLKQFFEARKIAKTLSSGGRFGGLPRLR